MLQHVLVPLDGSELAEEALEKAQRILADGARISLVAAIDVPNLTQPFYPLTGAGAAYYRTYSDELVPETKSYLERVAEKLRLAGYQVEVEVVVGDPPTVIVDSAKDLKVDAIVMSTHGRSGFSRWMLGSVAGKVLSTAPCSVFISPSAEREREKGVPEM